VTLADDFIVGFEHRDERFLAELRERFARFGVELHPEKTHAPISEQEKYLRAVVAEHVRYYGVPLKGPAIGTFRLTIGRLWKRSLERRSQRTRISMHSTDRVYGCFSSIDGPTGALIAPTQVVGLAD
jgi:hypothetical protein